ncbi:MAG: hypothetical protein PSN37_01245 [Alphaproteobacteria bacterium]|nr:hypothetical protein [Alphaproteobacteria bacterium]
MQPLKEIIRNRKNQFSHKQHTERSQSQLFPKSVKIQRTLYYDQNNLLFFRHLVSDGTIVSFSGKLFKRIKKIRTLSSVHPLFGQALKKLTLHEKRKRKLIILLQISGAHVSLSIIKAAPYVNIATKRRTSMRRRVIILSYPKLSSLTPIMSNIEKKHLLYTVPMHSKPEQ